MAIDYGQLIGTVVSAVGDVAKANAEKKAAAEKAKQAAIEQQMLKLKQQQADQDKKEKLAGAKAKKEALSTKSNTLKYVAIAIGSLIVIGGGIVLVFKLKSK